MFLNKKKSYFDDMIKDANRVIWDLEFKKYTALNEREVIRRQYDQAQDALGRIGAQLIKGPDEKIEAEKKTIEAHVENLKKEMDAVEATIIGGAPSELLPDGAEGIDNKLKTWVQRRELIKGFIKHNC
jgi:hypothetical protein